MSKFNIELSSVPDRENRVSPKTQLQVYPLKHIIS